MKAVICNSFGPIDSLSLENVEGLKSNEEEVEVGIKAAALNFPDVLMVEGNTSPYPNSLSVQAVSLQVLSQKNRVETADSKLAMRCLAPQGTAVWQKKLLFHLIN